MNEEILITPEILEKNGFERNVEETPIFTLVAYSIDADNLVLMQRPKGGWKLLCGDLTKDQAKLFFGDEKFVCKAINYISELQQALDFCGIEKTIEV